jgi:hypothetical protein
MSLDRLAALYPDDVNDLPVAWHQLRIAGPPASYRLTPRERDSDDLAERFGRRTIMAFDIRSNDPAAVLQADRLAFVDKAVPHSQYDLMCAEVSAAAKATVREIGRQTASAIWCSAYNFVAFVSRPEIQRTYGLQGGQLHLALNCDPNTRDRESIQASKQFHLHFLYWTQQELAALRRAERSTDARSLLQRRLLDPLAFVAPAVLAERLGAFDLDNRAMTLLPFHPADSIHGCKPMGCLIRLSDWAVLKTPEFVYTIDRIHTCIAETSAQLQEAFTGQAQPPGLWHRHALLPPSVIRDNIDRLGFSARTIAALHHLAGALSDVSPNLMDFMKKHGGARRRHLVLNSPCYALNLYAPMQNSIAEPLIAAKEVYLIIRVKLFSAIGGAGLLCLNETPCVRIVREEGVLSEPLWRQRTRFQSGFVSYNYPLIQQTAKTSALVEYRFGDFETGWQAD